MAARVSAQKRSTRRREFARWGRLNHSKTTVQRYEEVDGLRAVACALVIWHHVANAYAEISSSGLYFRSLAVGANVGWIGVLTFFAISGYVIPYSLRGARGEGVKRFATRRFWRLYPPFWFALLATWLLNTSELSAARLGWNFTMLPSLGGMEPAAGHFWTLEIEFVFYIVVALLFLAFGRLGWKVILPVYLILGACYLEWARFDHEDHWRWTLLYLWIMFWGALCREIMQFDFARWVGVRWVGTARAVALGLSTGALLMRPLKSALFGFLDGQRGTLLFGMSTSTAILLFLFWVIVFRVRLPGLARLGRWTYSTYLLHAVVFYGGLKIIRGFELTFLTGWPLPVYLIALMVLCYAVGGLAYRWIELPSDRVGHRLTNRPPPE